MARSVSPFWILGSPDHLCLAGGLTLLTASDCNTTFTDGRDIALSEFDVSLGTSDTSIAAAPHIEEGQRRDACSIVAAGSRFDMACNHDVIPDAT
jgi:hypothetical protein